MNRTKQFKSTPTPLQSAANLQSHQHHSRHRQPHRTAQERRRQRRNSRPSNPYAMDDFSALVPIPDPVKGPGRWKMSRKVSKVKVRDCPQVAAAIERNRLEKHRQPAKRSVSNAIAKISPMNLKKNQPRTTTTIQSYKSASRENSTTAAPVAQHQSSGSSNKNSTTSGSLAGFFRRTSTKAQRRKQKLFARQDTFGQYQDEGSISSVLLRLTSSTGAGRSPAVQKLLASPRAPGCGQAGHAAGSDDAGRAAPLGCSLNSQHNQFDSSVDSECLPSAVHKSAVSFNQSIGEHKQFPNSGGSWQSSAESHRQTPTTLSPNFIPGTQTQPQPSAGVTLAGSISGSIHLFRRSASLQPHLANQVPPNCTRGQPQKHWFNSRALTHRVSASYECGLQAGEMNAPATSRNLSAAGGGPELLAADPLLGGKKGTLDMTKSIDSQYSQASSALPGSVRGARGTVSGRLVRRTQLFAKRRDSADWALAFALAGIALMVVENELTSGEIIAKAAWQSNTLKSLCVLCTFVLLCFIIHFHTLEVQLFLNDNSAEDWRIALTNRRVGQMALEFCICAVCPLPWHKTFIWPTIHSDGETVTRTLVSWDVLLSIPMFLRLYLICRVMLLHSRLFTDASSRSIGALNRVNFNARFVLKTLMTLCPGTVLLVVTASFWIIASWILRLCERHHAGDDLNVHALKHQNYLNSLWMIAITFLSVGYGDMVPNTYCGRATAVIAGTMGVSTASFAVAVIARKLELTRAEKHVHNFMMDTQLTKRLKHAAANVLRETWLIYKYRRLMDKVEPGKIRQHQRKFLMAIYELRKVKRDQRKLAENAMTLGDIAKTSSNTYELVADMSEWQDSIADRLLNLETQMGGLQADVQRLSELLAHNIAVMQQCLPNAAAGSSATVQPSRQHSVQQPLGGHRQDQMSMDVGSIGDVSLRRRTGGVAAQHVDRRDPF